MSNTVNTANAFAAAGRETLEYCADYAALSIDLARLFLIAALIVVVVETAVTLWAKIVAARVAPKADPARADVASATEFLKALKDLLEGLAKLPAWVAIFLAGLALLWMSTQRPEICGSAGGGSPPGAAAPKAPSQGGRKGAPAVGPQAPPPSGPVANAT